MGKKINFLYFILIFFFIFLNSFVSDVQAIVANIQDVNFWINEDNTILNITFFHTPVNAFHYADRVEVDIDGIISSYSISQSSTTYTAMIDLAVINGEPIASTRIHCTVDGWSSWSNPQNIPEFSSWMIFPLFLIISILFINLRKQFCN